MGFIKRMRMLGYFKTTKEEKESPFDDISKIYADFESNVITRLSVNGCGGKTRKPLIEVLDKVCDLINHEVNTYDKFIEEELYFYDMLHNKELSFHPGIKDIKISGDSFVLQFKDDSTGYIRRDYMKTNFRKCKKTLDDYLGFLAFSQLNSSTYRTSIKPQIYKYMESKLDNR